MHRRARRCSPACLRRLERAQRDSSRSCHPRQRKLPSERKRLPRAFSHQLPPLPFYPPLVRRPARSTFLSAVSRTPRPPRAPRILSSLPSLPSFPGLRLPRSRYFPLSFIRPIPGFHPLAHAVGTLPVGTRCAAAPPFSTGPWSNPPPCATTIPCSAVGGDGRKEGFSRAPAFSSYAPEQPLRYACSPTENPRTLLDEDERVWAVTE